VFIALRSGKIQFTVVPLLEKSNETFILHYLPPSFYHERMSEAEAKSHSAKLPQLQCSSKLMFISSPVFCEVHDARSVRCPHNRTNQPSKPTVPNLPFGLSRQYKTKVSVPLVR
jgi:hypothetical protein